MFSFYGCLFFEQLIVWPGGMWKSEPTKFSSCHLRFPRHHTKKFVFQVLTLHSWTGEPVINYNSMNKTMRSIQNFNIITVWPFPNGLVVLMFVNTKKKLNKKEIKILSLIILTFTEHKLFCESELTKNRKRCNWVHISRTGSGSLFIQFMQISGVALLGFFL